MRAGADRPVPYWPHYMPGPGAAIPYQLTPLAETALAGPEPEIEVET
jgi:hypothetical protein